MKPKKRTNPKHQKIQTLRHHIDQVDNQIVELLAKRQQLVVK
ncbi:MAG: chorismate mutase, partial [Candidatus Chisholmbacteria bacterium]|nr:chorismate mutase [Candidatus Chisholmbacteria bacterium]